MSLIAMIKPSNHNKLISLFISKQSLSVFIDSSPLEHLVLTLLIFLLSLLRLSKVILKLFWEDMQLKICLCESLFCSLVKLISTAVGQAKNSQGFLIIYATQFPPTQHSCDSFCMLMPAERTQWCAFPLQITNPY